MNKIRLGLFALFLIIVLASGCRGKNSEKPAVQKPGKEEMAAVNEYLVRKDRERIQNYIERKGLAMTETSSGLWYQVIEQGEGPLFGEGDKVVMDYDCSLLDGTSCYSSEKNGRKEIIIGKGDAEAGLREGLKILKPGAEAIFILPPWLAFGLHGDGKMIPPRAIIVYKVHILRNLK